jgi:alpha,alpha-trehalase
MDQKILKAACEQIQNLWPTLWRDFRNPSDPTLIAVPHPHLVPGGVFDEFYYWDSYFTMLGLTDHKHEPLLRGMVDNFLFLFEKY